MCNEVNINKKLIQTPQNLQRRALKKPSYELTYKKNQSSM